MRKVFVISMFCLTARATPLYVASTNSGLNPRHVGENEDRNTGDSRKNQENRYLLGRATATYPDEDKLNMDLLLFSLSFLFFLGSCYLMVTFVYLAVKAFVRRSFSSSTFLRSSDRRSNNYSADRLRTSPWASNNGDEEDICTKFSRLTPEEQFYYKQGEEFIKHNPPFLLQYSAVAGSGRNHSGTGFPNNNGNNTDPFDPIINDQTLQYIEEEGAQAWEFQPSPSLPCNFIVVENKCEITFLNQNTDVSVMANLPIPLLNKVYYFECKIFEINNNRTNSPSSLSESSSQLRDNEIISFGLATSPYPYFRLPGRHRHSITYDSTGSRRLNDSFDLPPELASIFPRCEKGDVVGVGYRTRSGTVFFTRNGKKLNEKPVGGHIKDWKFKYVYPIVGANVPCKVHVNFGTHGFVYIEANVKKWGYAKSVGLKLPPPAYEECDQDMLLESSYEDDGSDSERTSSITPLVYEDRELLPPPPGFEFSTTPNSNVDQFTMSSLPVEPPGYSSDHDQNQSLEPSNNTNSPYDNNATRSTARQDLRTNTCSNQFLGDSYNKQ